MNQPASVNEVWYLRIWGTFHIVVGVVFSLIFVIGAFFLTNYTLLLYLLFSGLLIYMGFVRLRKPYLSYTISQIEVRGMYGEIYKTYTWQKPEEIMVKSGRIFLNGKKLRFNSWFTNHHQYNHMIHFFSEEPNLEAELQD